MPNRSPRRQHYVPVNYLAGFTESGKSSELLLVIDQVQCRSWKSRPNATAYETDFYTIPDGGDEAYVVKEMLSTLENAAAPALRRMRSAESLDGDDLELVLNFAALQAVRGPGPRRSIHDALMRDVHAIFNDILSSEQSFEAAQEYLSSTGNDSMPGTREEIRNAFENAEVTLDLNKFEIMRGTLTHYEYVLNLLSLKHWQLIEPSTLDDAFITSDNPMPLVAQYRPDATTFLQFRLPWPRVSFPLSSTRALIGSEENSGPDFTKVSKNEVAAVNAFTSLRSRFLYCRDAGYPYASRGGTSTGADLLALWQRTDQDHET